MRRTPSLTKQVRDLYETYLFDKGYWPHAYEVCDQFDLTPQQVRDAVFAPAADEWRRDVQRRYNERLYNHASS